MTRMARVGGVAFIALVMAGCGAPPPAVELPPPPVSVSKPIERAVTPHDSFEGYLKAAETVEIRARVRGHLLKVHFVDGQMVKKGDLLYQIDPEQYEAALDSARAQLASAEAELGLAKAEYTRTKGLAAKNAASREELDIWTAKQAAAIAAKAKAQASIRQSEDDLKHTKITAPINGRISRTLVDEGNLVNAGGGDQLLTTIVSIDPMYVYFDVSERALLEYRRERTRQLPKDAPEPPLRELKIPVLVAIEGEDEFTHKGVIDFADNRVNPSTGTVKVRAVLSNSKRLFEDGMRARVQVPSGDAYPAILITERAVGSEQGRKYVYIVNDRKVVERRDVTLGRIIDGLQVIESGLKGNEWVIVNGIQRVRDGVEVKPNEVPMPDDRGAAAAATKTKEGSR